jgi:3-keto-L-gulonate-6-phosphate decarboxylase
MKILTDYKTLVYGLIEDRMFYQTTSAWAHVWSASTLFTMKGGARGSVVIEALCYKPEGGGFKSR